MTESTGYHDVLGIKRDAGFEEIKLAYRKLLKKYHPDLNEGDVWAKEKFIEIQEAYTNLSSKYYNSKKERASKDKSYYYNHNKTGKIVPPLLRIENAVQPAFIPKPSKRPIAVVLIALAAVIVLMILYYNSESKVMLTSGDFTFPHSSGTALKADTVSSEKTSIAAKEKNRRKQFPAAKEKTKIFRKAKNKIEYQPLVTNATIPKQLNKSNDETTVAFLTIEDYLSVKNHDELISVFGADAVEKSINKSAEGVLNKCSVLHLKPGKKIIFVWNDETAYSKISYIKTEINNRTEALKTKNSRLHSKQGIYLGMSLKELQKLNSNPVFFYGWGWGYDGILSSKKTGTIDFTNLTIRLTCENCGENYLSGGRFSSADKVVDKENIFVSSITIPG